MHDTRDTSAQITRDRTLVRWQGAVLLLGVVALTLSDALWVARGVNPYSLWLDDQWVATLVKHASPAQLFDLKPPAPVGFVLLLKAVTAVLGWGHWQLQVLPMLCGFLQILLIGWIAWRVSGRVSLGLIAATLLSGSRTLMVCSLRVKQYTLEGLIVLMLIALALACVRRPRPFTFTLTIIAGVLALPFSFTAVPVGLVIVNVLAVHLLRTERRQMAVSRTFAISACAAYDVIVLLWIWLMQSRQANSLMFSFWADRYLPMHDPSAMWPFARRHLAEFFSGALPSGLGWLAAAVPLGVALLLFRRPTRLIGIAFLLFYAGMLGLSAAGRYPLGGRRTDVFSYPITILAIIGALWALSRFVRFLPQVALLGVALYALLTFHGVPIDYPTTAGRSAVEEMKSLGHNDDGLIIAPQSSWAFGCYGHWPVELVPAEDSSNRFIVEIHRPHTLVLREAANDVGRALDVSLAAQLDGFLSARPRRIFYASVHAWSRPNESVTKPLESRGYVGHALPTHDGSVLMLFKLPQGV